MYILTYKEAKCFENIVECYNNLEMTHFKVIYIYAS
jgi:hypothetical protein